QMTKEQRRKNPVLGALSERQAQKIGVVQSRRLDRINQLRVLDTSFHVEYGRMSQHLRPEVTQVHTSKDSQSTRKPGNPVAMLKSLDSADRRKLVNTAKWLAKRDGLKASIKTPDDIVKVFGAERLQEVGQWAGVYLDDSLDSDTDGDMGAPDGQSGADGRGVREGSSDGSRAGSAGEKLAPTGWVLPN